MLQIPSRAAGPVTVTLFKKGVPAKEFVVPAPTLATTKDPLRPAKRGPKPGAKFGSKSSQAAARFLQTENWY